MRRGRLVLLAALVAVLAGGCTSGRNAAAPAPSGDGVPRAVPTPEGAGGAAAAAFPLDQFMVRPAQANDLDTVVKRLTRACLLSRGEDWRGGERNEFDLLRRRAHRFGLDDEQLAASVGYHWDTVPGSPDPRGLDDCAGEAYRAVGWAPDEFRWLGQLAEQTVEQTYADPRAATVTRRWSECMDRTGFRYAAPLDAEADSRWWRDARAGVAEKQTAVADTRCKTQVRFAEQLSGVLAEKQVRAVRDNARRLEAFRRMATAAATKADAVRGDHRTPQPGGSGKAIPPGMWRTEHTSA